jgi:starch phosphorylase
MSGTRFTLEVQPRIPKALARLPEIANDLVYSWSRPARGLFANLDRELWHNCGHNPKLFLRRVAQEKLDEAAKNLVYLQDYHGVLSDYETYLAKEVNPDIAGLLDPEQDLVAYFCAEFGLHESLPIYSGGLGILAGDHCKAASDLGVPFVAVGLLYRVGNFAQTIDGDGNQHIRLAHAEFNDLPITPVLDPDQRQLTIQVQFPGRVVHVRVWQAQVGHIRLYLLDTDLEANNSEDRHITHQLYGGDINTRIQQEMMLGIGGVRALRAMGLAPSVWHINEGHAAFIILERCRELVQGGLEFAAALEQVGATTVFTTHTAVPAGHDLFERELILRYFRDWVRQLGITEEEFLNLGANPNNRGTFNQTALALRGSRFHNGVSQIHGGVASRMESYVWPNIPPKENPMAHVTNGIHVPTFLAAAWVNLFDLRFGTQWRNELLDEPFWRCIDDLPDSAFWSVRQLLKYDLVSDVRARATAQFRRNGYSESRIKRLTHHLSTEQDILILGFARRFATYKRATLLFSDPARLARLLNDAVRPVLILFAGKAHQRDVPGQDLIRTLHHFTQQPEFEGKVLMLEGYDLALARRLVTGVDVWLNTPQFPLEASGTSGMKAGINGVINLSLLDGWWPEAYDGENGWAITPQGEGQGHDQSEARELLDLLEHEVIPLYYKRDHQGYSSAWVQKAKASMKTLIARYGSERMVMDYARQFYGPAARQHRLLSENHHAPAMELAHWKKRVRQSWPGISIRLLEQPQTQIQYGTRIKLTVAARLGGLTAEDVVMECLVGNDTGQEEFVIRESLKFIVSSAGRDGETLFELELCPACSGLQTYKLRMYPHHRLLTHPFEMGLMIWV